MAIARDAVSSGGANATSLTVAHTVTGSNTLLFSGFFISGGDNFTSLTCNAVNENLLAKTAMDSGYEMYLYYLAAPSTGNVVLTPSGGSRDMMILNSSYTGAAQSGIPDASVINTTVAGQVSLTQTVTVVATNSWLIGTWRNDASVWVAGANTSIVASNAYNLAFDLMDSNSAQAAGSRSMTATCSLANVTGIMASFKPFVAPIIKGNMFLVL